MRRILGLLLCVLSLSLTPSVLAQLQEKGSSISMDVTEAHLEDVLKLLSQQSGMNFVASEAARAKQITLYFDGVPIHDAIEAILKAHHLAIDYNTGQNLFVVTESDSPKVQTVTRVFRLKYARVVPSAGEVASVFGLTGSLIRQTLDGGRTTTTGSTGGGLSGGGLGGGLGGGGEGEETGIVEIVRSLLTPNGSVVADPRTNSLIVTDIPDRMPLIEETVAKLDVKPKQIYLEAEILEVTLDTLRRIGLEYGSSTGQFATFEGPKWNNIFPLTKSLFKGATKTSTLSTFSLQDADIVLKLLATEKDVKFLARPRLLTLSGEVAEIRIVSEPVTGVTSASQQDTGVITEAPERTTVGTILRVTPIVNDDQYITMIIEPEVSRVLVSTFNTKFQDPNRRLARTTVMVPDAGTAMIAGLISSEDSNAVRRVPGLGDLPLLGFPFKRTERERENTEILLFITPHIVEEDSPSLKTLFAHEREQAPLSSREQRHLAGYRQRILKERAIVETIEGIVR